MATFDDHLAMICAVARAIGPELCKEVAFVGGCTTALLLTDHYTLQQVRHTDDVDLIVHVIKKSGWIKLIEQLRTKGFKERMEADGPICAMYLGDLRVDFMPDDETVLDFTNIWYKDALENAELHDLDDGLRIKLVRPEYFVATKLEAYLSRGNGDPMSSRDIEDILTLLDGRPEIAEELLQAPPELRAYVSEQLTALQAVRGFDYAVQAASNDDGGREQVLFERIDLLISYGALN
ncbi:nucleotidyl transferase AbiEii/AbiGii toxin family protein [Paraburkholderia terrae]|uniref:nucleotidyl transferase AbiEii/AbiGii toxin family protein n=1 Tax=Paraburkholderia terrae TaxID=311230 RepID=UPI001EE25904|nr:nucleotidyl transferase AbiEii/AbiGii toxin family protein [Paraburkholderia terrae]GJH05948.1 hypothetical protein CBA19C8_35345 [Paraburkholderia terrae]